ncbi:MAG: putative Holliday junction resolvase [Verrucomicrobia bacterium ADurb.Bin345]|nr:MAG: putative Holliday junction resolvase [Verrucomicrobia bacterium ADurb.Bin345]
MPRILGLDYGGKRLGFAVSDPSGILSTPLRVAHCRTEAEAAESVVAICAETRAERLVVGLPLNMNGSKGPQAERVENFVGLLRNKLSIPIETWDERLSTREAERVMTDAGVSARQMRGVVDKLAAQLILQSYLDAQHPGGDDDGGEAGPGW